MKAPYCTPWLFFGSLACVLMPGCGTKEKPADPVAEERPHNGSTQSTASTPIKPDDSSGTGTSVPSHASTAAVPALGLVCPDSIEVSKSGEIRITLENTTVQPKLEWALEKPPGSSANLSSSDPARVSLTPDLAGAYRIIATMPTQGTPIQASCIVSAVGAPPKVPLTISNPSNQAQADAPFTFGQPFKQGAYSGNQKFELQVEGRATPIVLQTDAKVSHPDGTLRHAVFSGLTGPLAANEVLQGKLSPVPLATPQARSTLTTAKVITQTQDLSVSVALSGKTYSLSLHQLLSAQPEKLWLDGTIAKEWHVHGSFKDGSGVEHPHLQGIFNLRVYGDARYAMVDVVVENNWTYQAKPKNELYDVVVSVGNSQVYAQTGLYHLHRTRWKKKFWLSDTPQVHVAHDTNYLMETKSVPRYEAGLVGNIASSLIDTYASRWKPTIVTKALDDNGNRVDPGNGGFEFSYDNYGPMGTGLAQPFMGTTGGRPDIGPLPRWVTSYLLNQDPVSKKVALGMADLAGSWPMHYRDKNTGQIVSIEQYPYASVIWNQGTTLNPDTGKREGPTPCEEVNKAHCSGYFSPDSSHQPSFAYVPYLLTGDYYYLEELHFWANYNFLNMNPSYRQKERGHFTSQQDRGQAWSLRTLGHTVYITPDSHPLRAYFSQRLDYNLEEYKKRYVDNPPNQYGALKPNYSFPVASPWMDDFFTWAMGALVDLGFENARSVYEFKSQFPVQRMGFGPDEAKVYCWILGSAYQLRIAEAKGEPMYQTIDEVYRKNNGVQDHRGKINIDDKGLPCGSQEQATAKEIGFEQMIGWGLTPAGFPSNMRPALAVAADSGIPGAKEAWKKFIERKTKPDYSGYPVWAVVPRTYSGM